MRTALALCLIAGASGPTWATGPGEPFLVAPFVVLESHPLCSGPGKIAFQVPFDAKNVTARFGHTGQNPAVARTCTIKTRHGGRLRETPIPCPELDAPALSAQSGQDDLPHKADLSGDVIGCMGLNEINFVEGNWTLHVDMAPTAIDLKGDISSPDLTVLFTGPKVRSDLSGLRTVPSVLALLWDGVAVPVPGSAGETLEISTYLALVAQPPAGQICVAATCIPMRDNTYWLVQGMGGSKVQRLIDFVEGK